MLCGLARQHDNRMKVQCRHWREWKIAGMGVCALNLYGGKPSHGVCIQVCPHYKGPRVLPPVHSTDCLHRGEQIDDVQCPTCQGVVMAKVVACTVHGRASLFTKPIDGVRMCGGCPDRKPEKAGAVAEVDSNH